MTTVAYGCEHLQQLFKEKKKEAVQQYALIQQTVHEKHPLVVSTYKNPRNDGRPVVTLAPTYLCLQCPNISPSSLRDKHWDTKGHAFSVDSKTGSLYCQNCKDFVYDPSLEDVRIRKGGKRRKSSNVITPDDARMVMRDTTTLECGVDGIRGLYNLGQTCYMSAVLQCLVHNPFLRAYYLSDGHHKASCELEHCSSCALDEIFADFYGVKKLEGLAPVDMFGVTWRQSADLAGNKQQDAHEFMQFVLNSLHTANSVQTDAASSGNDTVGNTPASTGSHDAVCHCIVHSTFFGKLQSTVTCEQCHHVSIALDPFMDLSLDLEEAAAAASRRGKKRKLSGAGLAASSQKEKKLKIEGKEKGKEKLLVVEAADSAAPPPVLDLRNCLERFTGQEHLNAAEYTCDKCHSAGGGATKQLSIRRLPPVVPIHLKRFEHSLSTSSKLEDKVKFPLRLDMLPYTTRHRRAPSTSPTPSAPTPTNGTTDPNAKPATALGDLAADGADPMSTARPKACMYELAGVIVHKGNRVDVGHYVSYCRDGAGGWFRFDDSKVVFVSEREVLAAEAYLLFYMVTALDG